MKASRILCIQHLFPTLPVGAGIGWQCSGLKYIILLSIYEIIDI